MSSFVLSSIAGMCSDLQPALNSDMLFANQSKKSPPMLHTHACCITGLDNGIALLNFNVTLRLPQSPFFLSAEIGRSTVVTKVKIHKCFER